MGTSKFSIEFLVILSKSMPFIILLHLFYPLFTTPVNFTLAHLQLQY